MNEKARRKLKRLLVMNARNRVTSKVSALNSSPKTNKQRIRRRLSKLLRITPPNPKGKRNNKKWPTFASWLLRMTTR